MAVEILTKEELENFKNELLAEISKLLNESNSINSEKRWLRSSEVRKLLKLSSGTLQNLRVSGTLPYSKVGGVIFFKFEDILNMLEKNRINHSIESYYK